jgi:hypothetical protein
VSLLVAGAFTTGGPDDLNEASDKAALGACIRCQRRVWNTQSWVHDAVGWRHKERAYCNKVMHADRANMKALRKKAAREQRLENATPFPTTLTVHPTSIEDGGIRVAGRLLNAIYGDNGVNYGGPPQLLGPQLQQGAARFHSGGSGPNPLSQVGNFTPARPEPDATNSFTATRLQPPHASFRCGASHSSPAAALVNSANATTDPDDGIEALSDGGGSPTIGLPITRTRTNRASKKRSKR